MKAKNQNAICRNRNKLEEVLPLKGPYSLVIDSCNLCNFKCRFCAVHTTPFAECTFDKKLLSLDFKKK